jgi:hypothetical protein
MNGPEDRLHDRFSPMNRHSPARIERPFRAHDRTHALQQNAWLFDHFVGAQQERLGDCQPECLGGCKIDVEAVPMTTRALRHIRCTRPLPSAGFAGLSVRFRAFAIYRRWRGSGKAVRMFRLLSHFQNREEPSWQTIPNDAPKTFPESL